jgi:hypothetical protein
VITASVHLMSARVLQADALGIAVQRHVTWGNTRAINQQYAFTWAMRDTITRLQSTSTLAGWGGVIAEPFIALQALEATARPSALPGENSYPFNNIANTPTSDNGVYFVRTEADSDVSQTEHLAFFNYLKSYPPSLLGDLLVVHKKPSTATGTYLIGDNLQVNGRVLIWDSTANTTGIRAQSCLNMTKTGTNTTRATGSGASTPVRLPQNFSARVSAIAGYGGSGTPTAVTNGSLNLANNTDFTPSSIRHTMEGTGLIGLTWVTGASGLGILTNISTSLANGSSTSDTQTKLESSPTYSVPTTSPYNYTPSSPLNVFCVRLKNSSLRHLHIISGVEQLVLEGQTSTTDYTNAGTLPPVIIWLDQPTCRDIRFVGENNRRLILVTGRGSGATIYCGWHGNSLVGGSSLRWRMHWINENRALYLNSPTGLGVLITGGIRTDWTMDFVDNTNNVRFTLQRETDPGTLLNYLPRDGWLEPYAFVR